MADRHSMRSSPHAFAFVSWTLCSIALASQPLPLGAPLQWLPHEGAYSFWLIVYLTQFVGLIVQLLRPNESSPQSENLGLLYVAHQCLLATTPLLVSSRSRSLTWLVLTAMTTLSLSAVIILERDVKCRRASEYWCVCVLFLVNIALARSFALLFHPLCAWHLCLWVWSTLALIAACEPRKWKLSVFFLVFPADNVVDIVCVLIAHTVFLGAAVYGLTTGTVS